MNAELMSVDKNFSYAVELSVNLFLSPSLGGELFISPPAFPGSTQHHLSVLW